MRPPSTSSMGIFRDRREQQWNRHARPHRFAEIPIANYNLFAADEVGRDSTERYLKIIKTGVGMIQRLKRQDIQKIGETLARGKRRRDNRFKSPEANGQEAAFFSVLLIEEQISPRRLIRIGNDIFPDCGVDKIFEFSGRVTGSIQSPDDASHARSNDEVDRNMMLFKRFEHTHGGNSARATATQNERNLGALDGFLLDKVGKFIR